jgi:hypothetical protein
LKGFASSLSYASPVTKRAKIVRRVESARAPNLAFNTATAMLNLLIYKPYGLIAIIAVVPVIHFDFPAHARFTGMRLIAACQVQAALNPDP